MSSHQSKEEGEISDEDESGKISGVSRCFSTSLMPNMNNFYDGRDNVGEFNRPTYNIYDSQLHTNKIQSYFGTLPNPRNILPRPSVPTPYNMKKEQDRACIVIKNTVSTNTIRNKRKPELIKTEPLPLKSPSSKSILFKIISKVCIFHLCKTPWRDLDMFSWARLVDQY